MECEQRVDRPLVPRGLFWLVGNLQRSIRFPMSHAGEDLTHRHIFESILEVRILVIINFRIVMPVQDFYRCVRKSATKLLQAQFLFSRAPWRLPMYECR